MKGLNKCLLLAVVCLAFCGCKNLTGQSAQEKLNCYNQCKSICTTDSCRYNCASQCDCTYTAGDTGGMVRCKGD